MSDTTIDAAGVLAPVDGAMPELVECYVDLHRNPELSTQEHRTARIVAERLTRSGYEVAPGVGGTGVVGALRNGEGPTVALRADRDAWRGTLLWFAQPAEETIAGARLMLRDGLYDRFGTPDVVLGQHVGPFPAGMVFHRPGPMMAGTQSIDVTIFGRGGHGSRPETTVDPVVVGAYIVTRLQTIVSREIEPLQPAVVTVGEFHAGTKANVIPDRATLALNIRAFDDKVQRQIVSAIERIVRAEADAARCPRPPEIRLSYGGPVTSNDAAVVDRVKAAHLGWFGDQRVMDMPVPAMGSEDFGLFAHPDGDSGSPRTVPTGFWFWGGASAEQIAAAEGESLLEKIGSLPSNHHPGFMVDPEPTLRTGVESLAVAALAYLGS
jgi:metal-dependent amidase/aminoacylase/carboxypeptidase family protein